MCSMWQGGGKAWRGTMEAPSRTQNVHTHTHTRPPASLSCCACIVQTNRTGNCMACTEPPPPPSTCPRRDRSSQIRSGRSTFTPGFSHTPYNHLGSRGAARAEHAQCKTRRQAAQAHAAPRDSSTSQRRCTRVGHLAGPWVQAAAGTHGQVQAAAGGSLSPRRRRSLRIPFRRDRLVATQKMPRALRIRSSSSSPVLTNGLIFARLSRRRGRGRHGEWGSWEGGRGAAECSECD
jgi:hypothetical protein